MAHVKVQDSLYEIPEKFTLGELADIEEICGQGYDLTAGGMKARASIPVGPGFSKS